jgi:hypothetical protein
MIYIRATIKQLTNGDNSMTKIQAMQALEKAGLSFTANVIMNGCDKPTLKMKTILNLIQAGHDVRHAPQETLAIIIDGEFTWISKLDLISEYYE